MRSNAYYYSVFYNYVAYVSGEKKTTSFESYQAIEILRIGLRYYLHGMKIIRAQMANLSTAMQKGIVRVDYTFVSKKALRVCLTQKATFDKYYCYCNFFEKMMEIKLQCTVFLYKYYLHCCWCLESRKIIFITRHTHLFITSPK